MLAAITGARSSINMESYLFEDGEIGQRFADAMLAKQSSGVQVNLIYDSVGTLGTIPGFFESLVAAGINVVEFNPVNPLEAKAGWELNERDHRKLLVVDGRVAFLGGIDISNVYSGGSFSRRSSAVPGPAPTVATAWRDTDLHVEGPVVAEFQKRFMETWDKQKGPPLAQSRYFPTLENQGSVVVHAIGSSPDDPYSLICATLISAIDNAQTEVWLTNAYFVPDPQLRAALNAAVARGVDVKLVLPGSTDSALVFHAGRSHYDELQEAGIRIHERRGVLLHAKTAVIDGVWSTVGSTNLDWRSFLHNHELNAVVHGAESGDQMRAAFQADLAQSEPILLAP